MASKFRIDCHVMNQLPNGIGASGVQFAASSDSTEITGITTTEVDGVAEFLLPVQRDADGFCYIALSFGTDNKIDFVITGLGAQPIVAEGQITYSP